MKHEIKQLIQTLFKSDTYQLEPYPKGLTNLNFLLSIEGQKYIIRTPRSDSHQIVNRSHEANALELIKPLDLDVPTIYYNPQNGIKISSTIEGFLDFNDYHGQDKIQRTALLMRKLHSLQTISGFQFNPVERYLQYRQYVKKPLVNDKDANHIISIIKSLDYTPTLCHNDWVAGNIGFTPERDYLIDYEYAGDNDPYFDVMSFISENELNQDEIDQFLSAYFDHPLSQKEKDRLFAYQQLHNLLWCTWAMMMFESRHEAIYQVIAQLKYEHLILPK